MAVPLLRRVVHQLGLMRTAVGMLAVVALASMAGTWWPQGLPIQDYVAQYGVFWARVMWWSGLTDVYRAPWFVLLLALLVASVCACLWRNGPAIGRQLKKALAQQNGARVVNRAGYFLVHGAVVGVAVAGLMSGFLGWRGTLNLREGEADSVALVWRGASAVPKFLPFEVRNDGFEVEHYAGGMPRQYLTRLGMRGEEYVVAVNRPARVDGYTFYQATFGDGGSALRGVGVNVRTGEEVPFEARVYESTVLEDGTRVEILDFRANTVEDFGGGQPVDVGASVDYLVQPPDAPARQLRAYAAYPQVVGVADGMRGEAVAYRPVLWEGVAGTTEEEARADIAQRVAGLDDAGKLTRALELWQQWKAVHALELVYTLRLEDFAQARFSGLMVARDPGAWLFWPSAALGIVGVVCMVVGGRRR